MAQASFELKILPQPLKRWSYRCFHDAFLDALPNSWKGKWLRSYPFSSSSCRTLLITDNPVAYYNYSNAGTFTVKVRVVAEWEQTKPDATKGIVQKSGDFSASLRLRGRSPARLAVAEEPQTTILPDPCDSGLAWGCTMWIFSEPSSLFHVCSGESTQGRRQSHTVSP